MLPVFCVDRDWSLRNPRLASWRKIDSRNQKGMTYSWNVVGVIGGAPINPHSGIIFVSGKTINYRNLITKMQRLFKIIIIIIIRRRIGTFRRLTYKMSSSSTWTIIPLRAVETWPFKLCTIVSNLYWKSWHPIGKVHLAPIWPFPQWWAYK